jgi:cell wall-associated NlpC family hydrolase
MTRDLADPEIRCALLQSSLARRRAARARGRAARVAAVVAAAAAVAVGMGGGGAVAAPRASAAALPTLKQGDRGAAVRRLQRRLRLPADGIFGPRTARAVRRFQRRRGLTVDGIVGPATWRALGVRGGARSGRSARVRSLVHAANRIARKPYKWGGGHGRWTDSGYDCSGAVSYVLHAAGLLRASRTADRFMTYGIPGRGRRVTIYARSAHVFMVIDGRRFDTTGRDSSGSFWQPRMRPTSGFVARHPAGL